MGLRTGLVAVLADAGDRGITPDQLAERLGLDPYYVATWCRAAFGAQVCDRDGEAYRLATQMAGLLLDEAAPTFASAPGRVMSGIQFFEAQIDDQLVPRRFYDDLLGRHGFHDIGSVALTPMDAVTYGRA